MTFYRCDCGVAHGNLHTPWQENQCPHCDFYPPLFVRGIKVVVGERGGTHWVYLVGKNNEKTFLTCYCSLPSVEDIESVVDFWLASLTNQGDNLISREGYQLNIEEPVMLKYGVPHPAFCTGAIPYLNQVNLYESMVSEVECESMARCTYDTFLLMQSGCKCGFIERERRAKNA